MQTFVSAFQQTKGVDTTFMLPAKGLMHIVSEEEIDYGLSLLREAIVSYERSAGIPIEHSKAQMPLFRANTRQLVGPEMSAYVLPLYEQMIERPLEGEPTLILSLDYQALGEHCLYNDYSLVRCKTEKESIIRHFMDQLTTEYDQFFYDEEHTGFTPTSRFFSLMCNACIEAKRPQSVALNEWSLTALRFSDEVNYRLDANNLVPYWPIELPISCLKQIYLEDFKKQPLLYGTLNGFLKSKRLPAEQLLNLV